MEIKNNRFQLKELLNEINKFMLNINKKKK